MKQTIAFLLILLLFGLPIFLFGGTTGKISGKIIDADTGDELPTVNVVIVGTTLGASTDLNGYFTMLQVQPGVYTLQASMIGYKTHRVTNVQVSVDLTTNINFKLEPTVLDLGEEVTVTAERPIVQVDETASTHRVSRESIENMPVTTMRDLVATQAGVVGQGLHINVRGGRTGEVLTVVDGQSVRDPLYSQASRTTQEQVMEFSNNPVDELASRSGGMTIPANAILNWKLLRVVMTPSTEMPFPQL